jgi:hypothetical protein
MLVSNKKPLNAASLVVVSLTQLVANRPCEGLRRIGTCTLAIKSQQSLVRWRLLLCETDEFGC